MIRCTSCGHGVGQAYVVVEGLLGTYVECSYCYAGVGRPPEPELITDTFTRTVPSSGLRSLDVILDKLTGERRT